MGASVLSVAGAGTAGMGGTAAGGLGSVAAALPAVGSIVTGLLSYYETKRANTENLKLAKIVRQDTLAANRANLALANRQLALNRRGQAFTEQETLYQRGRAQEQTNFDRRKDQYNSAVQLLSTKAGLVRNRTAPLIKRG